MSQEFSEGRVGIRDFAVVQASFVGLRVRSRRLVRIMWVVQMHPCEPRTSRMSIKPLFGVLDDISAAALHTSPAGLCGGSGREVVIKIEPAIETGCQAVAIENNRANKRSCVIAVPLQQGSQGRVAGIERDGEVGYTMRTGEQARQNTCVRSVSDRTGRERRGKANSCRGKRIEGGRRNVLVSKAMHVVGTKRVDSDEVHVRL